jgi:hypothetical protein
MGPRRRPKGWSRFPPFRGRTCCDLRWWFRSWGRENRRHVPGRQFRERAHPESLLIPMISYQMRLVRACVRARYGVLLEEPGHDVGICRFTVPIFVRF